MSSRRRGTTWPGRFWVLTTGSPVGCSEQRASNHGADGSGSQICAGPWSLGDAGWLSSSVTRDTARKWRDPLYVHKRSLWPCVEDRLEGARVEAGSPVAGPAAVGARGGGGRAVGGGRDSRQERREVAGSGTRFERRMDEACPLCPPPSDSPGLSLCVPAVPPHPHC